MTFNFRSFDRNTLTAIALIVVMILYGSLYPFDFEAVTNGAGPLRKLFGSWAKMPGRGDFISNILLYMPLGLAGTVTRGQLAQAGRFRTIVLIGAIVSFSVEYLQYYDIGRDTEATDFYANVVGTALGAGIGRLFGQNFRVPLMREIVADPIPAMLIASWMGYRLYPYVPTIDLHKYWNALKPIVLAPELTLYALFRQAVVWLILCLLIEKIADRARTPRLFFLFAMFVLIATIFVLGGYLNVARILGIGAGYALWRALGKGTRTRFILGAIVFGIYIAAQRLEPFVFTGHAGHFSWVPFLSFMRGSIDLDVQSFFEKFFLYGSMIWLLGQTGMRARSASILLAAALFATSLLEVFIPGRSAEITDALLALAIGGLIHMIRGIEHPQLAPTDTLSFRLTYVPDDDYEFTPDRMGEMRSPRRADGF